jgi:hypothetical protein
MSACPCLFRRSGPICCTSSKTVSGYFRHRRGSCRASLRSLPGIADKDHGFAFGGSMMSSESIPVAEGRSVRSLTAWLSLCLLSASWGARLDPFLRGVWAQVGCYGLVAAVGLDRAERTRSVLKRKVPPATTRERMERALANVAAKGTSLSAIAAAVNRISQECDRRDLESGGRRKERRVRFPHPVRVLSVGSDRIGQRNFAANAISADVRNISPSGVGLLHKDRIDGHRFWLHLELFNGETISVFVERLWQHRRPDGPYQSGGWFMEIAATSGLAPLPRADRVAGDDGLGQTSPKP